MLPQGRLISHSLARLTDSNRFDTICYRCPRLTVYYFLVGYNLIYLHKMLSYEFKSKVYFVTWIDCGLIEKYLEME